MVGCMCLGMVCPGRNVATEIPMILSGHRSNEEEEEEEEEEDVAASIE